MSCKFHALMTTTAFPLALLTLVLTAGLATRLRPLSLVRAKAALPEVARVKLRRPSYGQTCTYEG